MDFNIMINVKQLLEFENIFPDEEAEPDSLFSW